MAVERCSCHCEWQANLVDVHDAKDIDKASGQHELLMSNWLQVVFMSVCKACVSIVPGLARRLAWLYGHIVTPHCLRLCVCLCDVQGLEVYSTVLWHMKKEVEVSYLAQEAIAQDRRSPHAWAIMGNCFSLQKVCLPLQFLL